MGAGMGRWISETLVLKFTSARYAAEARGAGLVGRLVERAMSAVSSRRSIQAGRACRRCGHRFARRRLARGPYSHAELDHLRTEINWAERGRRRPSYLISLHGVLPDDVPREHSLPLGSVVPHLHRWQRAGRLSAAAAGGRCVLPSSAQRQSLACVSCCGGWCSVRRAAVSAEATVAVCVR